MDACGCLVNSDRGQKDGKGESKRARQIHLREKKSSPTHVLLVSHTRQTTEVGLGTRSSTKLKRTSQPTTRERIITAHAVVAARLQDVQDYRSAELHVPELFRPVQKEAINAMGTKPTTPTGGSEDQRIRGPQSHKDFVLPALLLPITTRREVYNEGHVARSVSRATSRSIRNHTKQQGTICNAVKSLRA